MLSPSRSTTRCAIQARTRGRTRLPAGRQSTAPPRGRGRCAHICMGTSHPPPPPPAPCIYTAAAAAAVAAAAAAAAAAPRYV